jgi:hypothetical protein
MRLTLLSDGSTDQALLHVIDWLLRQRSMSVFESAWADLRRLPRPPSKLAGRVMATMDLYPCDLLVIHRDAEREALEKRVEEIGEATRSLDVAVVCLVPVRMQEAWFLFDEAAIRLAAGCPSGRMPLDLPPLKSVESVPDPKKVLFQALTVASNLSGRRRKQLRPDVRRVAALINDFSPLRRLQAFKAFEEDLCAALRRLGMLRTTPPPPLCSD